MIQELEQIAARLRELCELARCEPITDEIGLNAHFGLKAGLYQIKRSILELKRAGLTGEVQP